MISGSWNLLTCLPIFRTLEWFRINAWTHFLLDFFIVNFVTEIQEGSMTQIGDKRWLRTLGFILEARRWVFGTMRWSTRQPFNARQETTKIHQNEDVHFFCNQDVKLNLRMDSIGRVNYFVKQTYFDALENSLYYTTIITHQNNPINMHSLNNRKLFWSPKQDVFGCTNFIQIFFNFLSEFLMGQWCFRISLGNEK